MSVQVAATTTTVAFNVRPPGPADRLLACSMRACLPACLRAGAGQSMSVADFVSTTFNYKYEWRGYMALVLFGLVLLFRMGACVGLARLNFNKR